MSVSVSVNAETPAGDTARRYLGNECGVTTIEYTMMLGFMSAISIFATISLIGVLQNMIAVLAIKIAVLLLSGS